MNLAVNNTSLFLAAMLVLVALGISLWQIGRASCRERVLRLV